MLLLVVLLTLLSMELLFMACLLIDGVLCVCIDLQARSLLRWFVRAFMGAARLAVCPCAMATG